MSMKNVPWIVMSLAGVLGAIPMLESLGDENFVLQNSIPRESLTSNNLDVVKRLESAALKDREDAAAAIRNTRSAVVNQLVELAGKKVEALSSFNPQVPEYPWHDGKHLAIILLGELRAPEGVPVLQQNLGYTNPKTLYVDEPLEMDWYPAVEALARIGMPAVDPMVARLSEVAPKTKESRQCCWILKEILGVKLARARIEIAIEETKDQTAKGNLKAALPYFMTPQEKAAQERLKGQ
jgi:hypothetical protein